MIHLGYKPWNDRKYLVDDGPQVKRQRCCDIRDDINDLVLDPFLEVDQIIDEIINETKRKEEEEDEKIKKSEELLDFVYSNHLIAGKIFEYLPVPDIITCACVRKSWYPNARYILRTRKRSIVKLECKGRNYSIISEFNRIFLNCQNCPFNGLSLSCSTANCNKNIELSLPKDLKLKYLYLNLTSSNACDGIKAVRALLPRFASTLEELHIEGLPATITSVLDLCAPNISPSHSTPSSLSQKLVFPNLRKLTLPSCSEKYCGHVEASLVKDLLTSSIHLRELHGAILPKFVQSIVEAQKLHLVKSFSFRVKTNEDLEACSTFVDAKHFVESLTLSNTSMCWTRELMGKFSQNIELLLQSNTSQLKQIEIDPYSLFIFTDSRSPTLTAVQHLRLNMDLKQDFVFTFAMLRKIDFQKFPNLNFVTLTANSYEFSRHTQAFLTLSSRRFLLGEGKLCTTVTKMKLIGNYPSITTNILPKMASIFPNIRHLQIDNCAAQDTSYTARNRDRTGGGFPQMLATLWTGNWKNLETLKLTGVQDENICLNLDTIFTGIPPESCIKLRHTKDYSRFEDLQSSLAIRNLTNLKSLQIQINHKFDLYYGDLNSPWIPELFLSDVTGYCSFAQMPELKVEISRKKCNFVGKRCCFLRLDSLAPFVSITEEDSDFSLDL